MFEIQIALFWSIVSITSAIASDKTRRSEHGKEFTTFELVSSQYCLLW